MYSTPTERWRATSTRDAAASTAFVYAVKTTGIFCRPTCKARLARRANVAFFDDAVQAFAAGFRACKRCKPMLDAFEPEKELIEGVCQRLEGRGELTLDEMAKEGGLSRWHFLRVFKRVMGITPTEWVKMDKWAERDSGLGTPTSRLDTPTSGREIEVSAEFSGAFVQYMTVQTVHGLLLVAFQGERVCKLDLATTELEALSMLEMAFPFPLFFTMPLSDDGSATDMRRIAAQVAEAVERPSGRTLRLSLSDAVVDSINATAEAGANALTRSVAEIDRV
ncbi:hypothetical protein Daus18300_007938 [Diaporthe australafricana]|uniref:HTH araC/xylS-type domain-containing protein n=1 Tax=Diaporthe australafricana TaxID=127596 RepID=A0ABR3WK10_9PEZI